jgi:hypothetical protein
MQGTMGRRTTGLATLLLAIAAAPFGAFAAQSQAAVGVVVSPRVATRAPNRHVQFTAAVSNSSDQVVTWFVNGVPGGAPSIGTISTSGLYVAPGNVPAAFAAHIQAVAEADPLATGAATVNLTASASTGATFHVATNGNDANDGSAGAPWRTIQHAATVVPAGGTVQVHAGVYKEVVTITRSGNATAGYITIEAAPGEAAVVDGTGLVVGNGGQQGLFTLFNANWVRVAGFEVRNFSSTTASRVPVGIYVYGSGSHVELLGNHVHDIVTTVKTSAGDALGIAVYGSATTPISNLIVDGNEVDHLVLGFSESLTINGNVQNWQVTNNTVHDNNNIGIVAIGFERTAPTVPLDQARDGWIADNNVYNITSSTNPAYNFQPSADGIYVDGGTRITIERNMVDHADLGIELASEHASRTTSYVTARDNVVTFSQVVGVSIGGYANSVGGTDHCTVVNNTLYQNDTTVSGTGEFQIQFHATNNVFANNVLYASSQGVLVNSFVAANTAPAAMDYNLYFTAGGASAAQWVWKNRTYTTLPAFRTASAGEAHGLFADPKFTSTSPSTFDLHLATGSPGIGTGNNLGLADEGSLDFDGNARIVGSSIDRGAYER